MRRLLYDRRLFLAPLFLCGFLLFMNASEVNTHTGSTFLTASHSSVKAAGPDFGSLAGSWVQHGAGLTVFANGHANYVARVYTWCGPGVAPPCDSFQGNTIISGNQEQYQFTHLDNGKAYGKVISSTVGHQGADVMLEKTPQDTVTLHASFFPIPNVLCGPRAPADLCGA
ncbi:hypothetical protein [Tengunoibacter tsumagoiensis]|uniref:Uncharacterized protein n=1 Tax=Tengunoibacter tsumagoiensis TaxID=2014871 RepID=A0A402A1T9_9CHLR|nr:hypothetical protein [Tengunoibacter tsumagoiensis]GCE13117.1 hypothetical protein KTT_29760 [Tengunoibacter tsumagoiensis]